MIKESEFTRMFTQWNKILLAGLVCAAASTSCQGASPTPAAVPVQPWSRTFEGPGYGALFDIILTPEGDILAVGASNYLHFPPYSGDALLVWLSQEGDVLRERNWGGEGYESALSVTPGEAGGYLVFGETDSYGAGDRDFFLLKIDEQGDQEWFQTYGGAGREWPFGMLPLSNGDLLLYGFRQNAEGTVRDPLALRVDQEGSLVWEYSPSSPEEDIVLGAAETAEGDIILTVNIEEDGALWKLDAEGNRLWNVRYELEGWQYPSEVLQTEEGGFLLAGFSERNGEIDTWIAHSNPAGELEWQTTLDNPLFDYAIKLIPLEDGTFLVGGLGDNLPLYCIDGEGSLLWESFPGVKAVQGAKGLLELSDGSFLVAGFIQLINGYSYDAFVLRTDSEGRLGE